VQIKLGLRLAVGSSVVNLLSSSRSLSEYLNTIKIQKETLLRSVSHWCETRTPAKVRAL
jgi:hypothetical protein